MQIIRMDTNNENNIIENVSSRNDQFNDPVDMDKIRFENKVYEKNAKFVLNKNGIINWFQSPVNARIIPTFARRNRLAFEKKVSKYSYNESSGILCKSVKGVDSIGMYILSICINIIIV